MEEKKEEKKIRPQRKWDEKSGLITKSYRIYKQDSEQFKEDCEKVGISQAAQLRKMMKEFHESIQ